MTPKTEGLTRTQNQRFDSFFKRVLRLVEKDQYIDDYSISKKGDGHFTSDDAHQYIELVRGELTITILVTARRNDK